MSDSLGLGELRKRIAQILSDNVSGDTGVFDAIPDSISPPAVYVTWSNPWLVSQTFCQYIGTLRIICVAARIEPGGQFSVLETLVSETLEIFHDNKIPVRDVTAPFPLQLGGVNYLAAAVNVINDIGD